MTRLNEPREHSREVFEYIAIPVLIVALLGALALFFRAVRAEAQPVSGALFDGRAERSSGSQELHPVARREGPSGEEAAVREPRKARRAVRHSIAAPIAAGHAGVAGGDIVATTLVRAAVAEENWNAEGQAAVLHTFGKRGARVGISADQMALRYASIFRARPTPRTRWVLQLERGCNQPEQWPAHLDWSRWKPECEATFARVDRFIAGDLPDPCPRATQFGSKTLPRDVARAKRAIEAGRWSLARCSKRLASNFYIERDPS